jgi:hypothetical protein
MELCSARGPHNKRLRAFEGTRYLDIRKFDKIFFGRRTWDGKKIPESGEESKILRFFLFKTSDFF